MTKQLIFIWAVSIALSSCSVVQKTAKKGLSDGFYTQRIDHKKQVVYIDIEDEAIHIYPSKLVNKIRIIDTIEVNVFSPKEIKGSFKPTTSFSKPSFDVDFLTIPLKFRPTQSDVPSQLNTNLNGAIYFGLRHDRYVLDYVGNPLGRLDQNINHFGFSFGAFTGLGNTFMSPTNTNYILQQEYDGIVWCKGVAGILAVNNFTIGLSLGLDHLLDNNRAIWIYQNKPWLGLAFGLNLN